MDGSIDEARCIPSDPQCEWRIIAAVQIAVRSKGVKGCGMSTHEQSSAGELGGLRDYGC
jgi:hypothetical protein